MAHVNNIAFNNYVFCVWLLQHVQTFYVFFSFFSCLSAWFKVKIALCTFGSLLAFCGKSVKHVLHFALSAPTVRDTIAFFSFTLKKCMGFTFLHISIDFLGCQPIFLNQLWCHRLLLSSWLPLLGIIVHICLSIAKSLANSDSTCTSAKPNIQSTLNVSQSISSSSLSPNSML